MRGIWCTDQPSRRPSLAPARPHARDQPAATDSKIQRERNTSLCSFGRGWIPAPAELQMRPLLSPRWPNGGGRRGFIMSHFLYFPDLVGEGGNFAAKIRLTFY